MSHGENTASSTNGIRKLAVYVHEYEVGPLPCIMNKNYLKME